MSAVPGQPRELRPIQAPALGSRTRTAPSARQGSDKENRPAPVPTPAGLKPQAQAQAQQKQPSSKKTVLPTAPAVIVDAHHREFQTGRVLGQGGFARVYDAVSPTGEHYAFKVIDKASVLTSKRNRVKLLAEMKIHKSMKHPHIVGFLDEFEDNANVYFKLELCAYGSINDMIKKRGRFSEEESRYFMVQILTACQHMHLNSVIHRDLKLGNIMLDERMQIKIGDFGLAALLSFPEERKRTVCGTPNYIAPEILYDQGQGHSFEVDIWSVGVILYTLVVGKPPFQTSNVQKIYERIKCNDYQVPADCPISGQARDLIHAILQPNPSSRPSLIQIMNHPWIMMGGVPRSLPTTSVTTMANLGIITLAQSQSNLLELQAIGHWIPNADDELPEEMDTEEDQKPARREDLRSRLGVMVDLENQRQQANSEAERAVSPEAPVSTLLQAAQQPLIKVPASAATSSRAPLRRPLPTATNPAPPAFTVRIIDSLNAAMQAYAANADLPTPLPMEAFPGSAALGPGVVPTLVLEPRADHTVRRSPPIPAAFILSWLDASDRYGLGYALSNGSVGVHFRDGSTTVLAPTKDIFEYVSPTRKASSTTPQSVQPADAGSQLAQDLLRRKAYPLPSDASGQVLSEAATDSAASALREAAATYLSRDLVNKLEILMYFQAEITDRLCGADHPLLRAPSPDSPEARSNLPFVHRWFRASTAIVFVFSDDLVQFNFYDHIKVLIALRGGVIGAIIPNEATNAGQPGGPPQHLLFTWTLSELVDITRRDRSQRELEAQANAQQMCATTHRGIPYEDLVTINITSPDERRAARRVWRKLPVCRDVLAKSAGLEG